MLNQRRLFIFVVFSAGFLVLIDAVPHCDTFTAGGCNPLPETKVGSPLTGIPEENCQDYCKEIADCEFYQFEKYDETAQDTKCSLFTADYRQECDIYGGDMDTDLATCIKKLDVSNTCDLFINHDCDYSYEEVALEAEPGSIIDAFHCQDLCSIFVNSLGCRYWVFTDQDTSPDHSTHCTLYKSATNIIDSCNYIHGPQDPYRYDCGPIEL